MKSYPKILLFFDILAGLSMMVTLGVILFITPAEMVMGAVQKVFYFHLSSAWVGMVSYLIAAFAAVLYLRNRQMKWDMASISAIEIGMVFLFITIVSGSIWAKPIWNTWWTWDPRLTTVTILELLYAAYFLLRQGIEEPEKRARFAAVYAVVGFLAVPLTFLSIRFYRTIHPVLIGNNDPSAMGTFDMTGNMMTALLMGMVTFSFLFISLFWHRIRLERMQRRIEEMRWEIED